LQSKVGSFLRFRCRTKNRPFVLFERFQPTFNVGGALVEFRRDADLSTQKTSTDFRDLS
jgi:hypothetical protein